MIIEKDRYQRVLIGPLNDYHVDKLTIVSGYASASMLSRHRSDLLEQDTDPRIDLTIGMAPSEGIASAQHNAYRSLQKRSKNVNCRYYIGSSAVHAKVYVWSHQDNPIVAFAGSANYTHSGFRRGDRIETMAEVDAESAYAFCKRIHNQSRLCLFDSISDLVHFHKPHIALRSSIGVPRVGETVRLSLLDSRSSETHKKSGLNWGHRDHRNRNEAYLPVPKKIYETGFFPPIGDRFIVQTDDRKTMIFVRAQQGGKALETPESNSIIGEYMRRRLNLKSGEYVTREHLELYGRTDVTMIRIDEETYFLDFSTHGD